MYYNINGVYNERLLEGFNASTYNTNIILLILLKDSNKMKSGPRGIAGITLA